MKYKHILIATDLSEKSQQIVDRTKTIADLAGATIDIVHVIEHSPIVYGGEFSIPINIDLEHEIETQARKLMHRLAHSIDVTIDRQHVISGPLKSSVIDLADQLDADLVVVGAYAYHGFDRLLGSAATAIFHYARCDVLTIHVHQHDET